MITAVKRKTRYRHHLELFGTFDEANEVMYIPTEETFELKSHHEYQSPRDNQVLYSSRRWYG